MVRSVLILGVIVSQALDVSAQECLSDAAALFQRTDKINFQRSTALMAQTRGTGSDWCITECQKAKDGFPEGCGKCGKSCQEENFNPTTCSGGAGDSCLQKCKDQNCAAFGQCANWCKDGGNPDTQCTSSESCEDECIRNDCGTCGRSCKLSSFNATTCEGGHGAGDSGGGGNSGGGYGECIQQCKAKSTGMCTNCVCFCRGGGNATTCEIGGNNRGDGEPYTPLEAALGIDGIMDHGVPKKWKKKAKWKKNKVIDPNLSPIKLAKKICPKTKGGKFMLTGLWKLYNKTNPFADPTQPTWAEIDEWHAHSLSHIRDLVGSDHPVVKDHCLFAKALWGAQRLKTKMWDEKYNEDNWSACAGPCYLSIGDDDCGKHCGTTFLPDPDDQETYLNRKLIKEGSFCNSDCQSSEGRFSYNEGDPWAIKWVRPFCGSLRRKGISGHTGPFFGRTNFGWSFFQGSLTAKWGGVQCNPTDDDECR